MEFDKAVTDAAGITVMVIGLVSLTESLLQTKVVGSKLPLMKGTLLSLFVVSFGAVLMTESATEAFRRLRLKYNKTK